MKSNRPMHITNVLVLAAAFFAVGLIPTVAADHDPVNSQCIDEILNMPSNRLNPGIYYELPGPDNIGVGAGVSLAETVKYVQDVVSGLPPVGNPIPIDQVGVLLYPRTCVPEEICIDHERDVCVPDII